MIHCPSQEVTSVIVQRGLAKDEIKKYNKRHVTETTQFYKGAYVASPKKYREYARNENG
jgi:hypothetical protein